MLKQNNKIVECFLSRNKPLYKNGVCIAPIEASDFDIYQQIYTSPKVMSYVGDVISKENTKIYFESALADVIRKDPLQILFTIKVGENFSTVGFLGIVLDCRQAEVGCMGVMLKPKCTKKGTARVAMELFIGMLFQNTNIKIIKSQHLMANKAAYFAAKSVGFKFLPPENNQSNTLIIYGEVVKKFWKILS